MRDRPLTLSKDKATSIALAVVSLVVGCSALEIPYRFVLWASTYNFERDVNHVAGLSELVNASIASGAWGLLLLLATAAPPISPKWLWRCFAIAFVGICLMFWIMRWNGGIVTYDEFRINGV